MGPLTIVDNNNSVFAEYWGHRYLVEGSNWHALSPAQKRKIKIVMEALIDKHIDKVGGQRLNHIEHGHLRLILLGPL